MGGSRRLLIKSRHLLDPCRYRNTSLYRCCTSTQYARHCISLRASSLRGRHAEFLPPTCRLFMVHIGVSALHITYSGATLHFRLSASVMGRSCTSFGDRVAIQLRTHLLRHSKANLDADSFCSTSFSPHEVIQQELALKYCLICYFGECQ